MSAVAGIVETNGRPVDIQGLQKMLRAMAHRGPDGTAVWADHRVALGHGLLAAAPQAEASATPVVVDGSLAVTADARLDNRDELMAALGLAGRPASDAVLILAAYRRWGEGCPEHLLGDFAFALWDGRRDLLFCARDHFGVKPFHYHAGAGRFAFASEVKALLALSDIPRRIDEARIADYLVALPPDHQSTLYADICRLRPGHTLVLTATAMRLTQYWRLEAQTESSGSDLAEQFRELFATATKSRLQGSGRVGAMLSGGLDSSSIACTAAPIVNQDQGRPLPTLSVVFDKTPAWSERPFIEAVLARGGFEASFIASDGYAPFAELDRILAEQDGVFLAPGLAISRQLYRAAAERGIRVLLDGHGGDEVVSHGYGRLHELARANRWLALWREANGVAQTYGDPTWRIFSAYLGRYGPGRSLARRAVRSLRSNRRTSDHQSLRGRLVNPDLAARTDLMSRWHAERRNEAEAAISERTGHARLLSSGLVSHAFEVLDRAAATAGVEPRYPFWDKRLVEFCVALPSKEKLDGGWSRLILRRAMEGVLPPAVQWRRDKLDFAPHIIGGMLAHHRGTLDRILLDDGERVGEYVALPAVVAAYHRILERAETADGQDVQAVWRTVALALWLRQTDEAPAIAEAAA